MTASTSRYACPGCGIELTWNPDNPHRPFCSSRCRNEDFVEWAKEEKVIRGNTLYDDVLSGDLGGEPGDS